ncbi:MAG: hypothetical protein SOZ80_02395 [Prevotella sp.]|uniref:hypothetical protein n=1 Tax=Prevotella sp. TaxID=59823 RepID=UPI002A254B6F|nr:hypothetical protein [Prevotella sp.]MDD7319107.1 hypothetical protein [Prevotellaceae bacterium]MDY4019618.1 hypothetical protein [Prevotella sp.]
MSNSTIIKTVFVLALFCCLPIIPASGQDKDNKNDKLREQVESMKRDTIQLSLSINSIRDSIELYSELIAERERELSSENVSAAPDTSEKIKMLNKECRSLNDTIKETKKRLSEISEMKGHDIMNIIYKKNVSLLEKRYSEITQWELDEINNTIDDFKNMDNFADYKYRITNVINHKKVVDSVVAILNNEFNEKKINDIHKKIIVISNKTSSQEQAEEIDSLIFKLEYYKQGLEDFQEFIRGIQKAKPKKNNIEQILKTHLYEKDKILKELVYIIPYLNRTFEQYKKELLEHPSETTEVEMEILKHKIEWPK